MTKLRVLLPLLVVVGIGLAGCIPPPPPPPPPELLGADLVAVDVAWPVPLVVGERVRFQFTVQNFGDTSTPANTILDVLVTVDGIDVGWSDNVTVPLAPGSSRVQMVNGGPDGSDGLWTVTAGSHTVQAYVNSGSLPARPPIPESNRDNNKLDKSFRVESPGTIAFISDRTGNPEVWMMNSDGSNQTQLTDSPDFETTPELSRDGSKIVFARRNADRVAFPNLLIWVMNADGSDQHPVVAPPETLQGPPLPPGSFSRDKDPAWSPDGTQIAFIREGFNTPIGLMVMGADGTGAHVVVATPLPERMVGPAWSPDGTEIAYVQAGVQQTYDVRVTKVDGTGGRTLTGNREPPFFPFDPVADHEPAWSPDGVQIALTRDGGLWVMSAADGSSLTALAHGTSSSWSPDGRRITFERRGAIWSMNTDGSDQVLITAAGGQPNWGPRH